jgi:hypothetical protein
MGRQSSLEEYLRARYLVAVQFAAVVGRHFLG